MIKDFLRLEEIGSQHNELHRILFYSSLGIIDKTFTAVPTLTQIPVGYMAKYRSGSTRRIYFNFDGTLTYFALTNA